MLPNGRASRRKGPCEYWQVAGRGAGVGVEDVTAGLTYTLPSSSGLRSSFTVLLLLSAAWLLALLSVNRDTLLFHYLSAACNCVQVPGPCPGEWMRARLGVGGCLVCQLWLSLPARAPSSSSPMWCSARRSGKHSSSPAAGSPVPTLP